ncbi:CHAD domain-containing protein [Kineococcus sp. GCM10028916]|uniref:CYTH and CHAD domain-containing protein n=1 Tax=Kineococcus sp. GCM10028916 TaxID=3273394 RepID=UPI003644F923
MVDAHEEIEVKYEFAPDAELPPLAALLPEVDATGLRVGDRGEFVLDAVYFDTPDLRLSGARTTLRRRTGGVDAGWHLKTPGDDGARLERRVPLGRAVRTVPVALRRLVEALTAGQALVPVVRLSTHRSVQTVLDASGRRLLELADDRVEAHRLLPAGGSGEPGAGQTWREVELELLDGDRAVFDAVDAALRAAGLVVSTSPSKVGRVLAGGPPEPAADDHTTDTDPGTEADADAETAEVVPVEVTTPSAAIPAEPRTLSRGTTPRRKELSTASSAGDVLFLHLREQVQQVFDQDARVRADDADSVHKMRVATRRLRSALRTFQPLLGAPTKPLRDELRWLAAELGRARDAEVLRDRLVQAVASLDVAPEDQPDDPAATGAVPQRVAEQLGSDYRRAHDQVLLELDSERYQRLLDTLQEFVEHPATSPKARRPAGRELPKRVARTYRTLAGLVAAAQDAPAGRERDELFHEARKAAKQVRYAAEAVAVVFGKDAKRFAAATTAVQEVLGEHQDSVVTRERLADLAARAEPEVAFAYGRLFAQEETHARLSESDVDDAWDALQAKRLHRWLR